MRAYDWSNQSSSRMSAQRPLLAGVNTPALNREKSWEFQPDKKLRVGAHLSGGDLWGSVPENSLMQHKLLVPPKAHGTVTYLAPAGNYTLTVTTGCPHPTLQATLCPRL